MAVSGTVVLHNGGDTVRLIIGEDKMHVVASKAVLCLLSPVFTAMITGGFRESSPDTVEIPLPEDNPNATLLLLRIGHLKFKDLPSQLSFQELHQLAIVCDKYDIIGPVRPFLDEYMKPYRDQVTQPGYEEWIFIAWTFGLEDIYLEITNHIVTNSFLSDGVLCCCGRSIQESLHPGADDMIAKIRYDMVNAWIQLLNKYFDEICNKRDSCSLQKLGQMTRRLYRSFSVFAKTSTVADLDRFSIKVISMSSAYIFPESTGIQCQQSDCSSQYHGMKSFIAETLMTPVSLPENDIRRLRSQGTK